MLKARYHKLRLRFSLWYSRTRNSWRKWWNENVSSIRLTKRGLLGIYLILVLLVGTVFMSRFQDRLGHNLGLEGSSPPTGQQEGEQDDVPSISDVIGVGAPETGESPGKNDPAESGLVQPSLAGSNDKVGQELAEPATAQMQLDRLYLPLADTKIQNNFALSTKSKTLGDWRSHLAVDFAVQNGAEVLAAAAGTVSKILTNDPYWGTVITLDHGGGWSTSYSNINSPTIRVGARVGARQPIGQVTENPPLELLDALHLHFVLLQNGQPMDPNSKWNE